MLHRRRFHYCYYCSYQPIFAIVVVLLCGCRSSVLDLLIPLGCAYINSNEQKIRETVSLPFLMKDNVDKRSL